jgi:hypothetical protein
VLYFLKSRKSQLKVSKKLAFLSTYSEDDFYESLNLVKNYVAVWNKQNSRNMVLSRH